MKTTKSLLGVILCAFFLTLLSSCGHEDPSQWAFYRIGAVGNAPGKNTPVTMLDILFECEGSGSSCRRGSTYTVHVPGTRQAAYVNFKTNYYDLGSTQTAAYFGTDSVSTWQTLFPGETLEASVRTKALEGGIKIFVARDSSIIFYHDSLSISNINFVYKWNR